MNDGVFISLQIGEHEFGNFGNNAASSVVEDLTINRTYTNVNQFGKGDINNAFSGSLSLIDTERDVLEYIISYIRKVKISEKPHAKLQYGYTNGEKSPIYYLSFTDIKPSDLFEKLNINFVAWFNKLNVVSPTFKDKFNEREFHRVSDVVKLLADESLVPYDNNGIVETDEMEEEISINDFNKTFFQIIEDLIVRYQPTSKEGSNFGAALYDLDGTGQKLYFRPNVATNYQVNAKSLKTYDFYVNALPNSKVINFTPTFQNNLINALVEETDVMNLGMISKGSDDILNITVKYDKNDSSNQLIKNDDSGSALSITNAVVIPNKMLEDVDNYIEGLINSDLDKYVFNMSMRTSGVLELIGDATINPGQYINVIALYPRRNYTSGAKVHPSSGTYFVKQVTDTIGSNGFTTKLNLDTTDKNFKIGSINKENIYTNVDNGGNE